MPSIASLACTRPRPTSPRCSSCSTPRTRGSASTCVRSTRRNDASRRRISPACCAACACSTSPTVTAAVRTACQPRRRIVLPRPLLFRVGAGVDALPASTRPPASERVPHDRRDVRDDRARSRGRDRRAVRRAAAASSSTSTRCIPSGTSGTRHDTPPYARIEPGGDVRLRQRVVGPGWAPGNIVAGARVLRDRPETRGGRHARRHTRRSVGAPRARREGRTASPGAVDRHCAGVVRGRGLPGLPSVPAAGRRAQRDRPVPHARRDGPDPLRPGRGRGRARPPASRLRDRHLSVRRRDGTPRLHRRRRPACAAATRSG